MLVAVATGASLVATTTVVVNKADMVVTKVRRDLMSRRLCLD